MKIYREIRIDIDTGNVLYEDAYDYNGPVAGCMGFGSETGDSGFGEGDYGGVGSGGMSSDSRNDSIDSELDSALRDVFSFQDALRNGMTDNQQDAGFWDSVKDFWGGIKNYVGLAFSFATGNVPGMVDYGPKALEDLTRQVSKALISGTKTPAMAVEEAAKDVGIDLSDSQRDAIANSLSEQLNKNGGEGWKTVSAAREAAASSGTNTGGEQVATQQSAQQGFPNYESALTYTTGAAAKRADEAWQIYKGTILPYELDFYNYARDLLGPQWALSKQYIDSQIQQMPGYTNAALKFYDEAANGVDEEERADQAQAEVEHSFKMADDIARRDASRMGLDMNDSSVLDRIQSTSLDRARGVAGARTGARTQAEAENFGRLYTAANMRPGGSAGIQFGNAGVNNQAATSASQSNLAQSGITSGLNFQQNQERLAQNAQQIDQNKPYQPDFSDLLVNTALSGLSKTDWSKIF
jgi:hypothetical protein